MEHGEGWNDFSSVLTICSLQSLGEARLYAAAIDLPDRAYRLHIGVFFGNLHGTLNHLLLTDRLWLKRLTGEGDHPSQLGTILYDDRAELTRARVTEDARLIFLSNNTTNRR